MASLRFIFLRIPIIMIKYPIYSIERINERIKEKYYKIETTNMVPVRELGIPMELWPVWYQSSANLYLRKVLKTLDIKSEDSIVDLGCGKGGAILYMAKFPFKKIVGVEYSKSIYLQAEYNINRVRAKRVHVIHGDAGNYSDLDDINYIYMFNPFGPVTMNKVLDNIYNSFVAKPRVITLIYLNPLLHDEIVKCGIFTKIQEFEWELSAKFFVYKTKIY